MKSNIVLDLGIGKAPTICRMRVNPTYLKLGTTLFPKDNDHRLQYIGFDNDSTVFAECHQHMKDYAPQVTFTTQCGDGVSLPFPDNYFSLIILSDVLSIPGHDWCMCDYGCTCRCKSCECQQETISFLPRYTSRSCCGEAYHGLPDENKKSILLEIYRTLRTNEKLYVIVQQTAEYAEFSIKFLESLPFHKNTLVDVADTSPTYNRRFIYEYIKK